MLHTLTKTNRQRRALVNAHITTIEDLVRAACNDTTSATFTIGLDKVFEVCNRRLSHLIVRGEDLKKDPRIRMHGQRPDTMVTFSGRALEVTPDIPSEQMENEDLVPPEWYCPLTHEEFKNPVFLVDGYTYEESIIRQWLSCNNTSPITGEVVGPNPLIVPNRIMRDWIARLS
tara:strand:+ start:26145 stop:26663 length:519 start_codon:yes stop_codon:yes gene_type:complete